MSRRRLLLFGVPVAFVVLGVRIGLALPRTAITQENAAKIQLGMTLAEVEAILGTGTETMPGGGVWFTHQVNPAQPNARVVYWGGGQRLIEVWFDDQLVVYRRDWVMSDIPAEAFGPRCAPPPTFFDKLRRWLRL